MIRVVLADPHPFFCEALSCALGEGRRFLVVGWATDELGAARLARRSEADLVVTEMVLAGGSGLGLARRLREQVRVVVLTRGHEGDVLLDAVAAGAAGCLSHAAGLEALASLLEVAAAGRFAVDADRLHEALVRAGARRSDGGGASPARLTVREREVLNLLAEGLDNEQIARQLYLSAHTVRTHVGNVLRKLGVHSRAEAARLVLRSGEGKVQVLRLTGPNLERP